MTLIQHMFKQHRFKFFAILALIAGVSVYYVFHSQAATDKYWVGGCSDDTWVCSKVNTTAVGADPWGVAITPDGAYVYVANSSDSTVSVIDTSNNSIVGLPITVGSQPQGLAITPDGAYVYVANAADTTVSVIDTSDNTVTGITTGAAFHQDVAITPDGAYAYVTEQSTGVTVIEISSNTPIDSFAVGLQPQGLAFTPDGAFLYIVNSGDGTVSVVDTSDNSIVGSPIAVGTTPQDVAITPDGAYAYVTNLADNTISVISTATNLVTTTISPVGNNPSSVAITPNGDFAYVTNANDTATTVIEISSNTVVDSVPSGYSFGIAITPNGEYAYTGDLDINNVYAIDLSSNTIHTATNWALSSGGTNEASTPDVFDNIFFDANSVGDSTVDSIAQSDWQIGSLDMTGYTGTLYHGFSSLSTLSLYGETLIMPETMTYVANSIDARIDLVSTTGGTIDVGGQSLGELSFGQTDVSAGTFTLVDNLSVDVDNLADILLIGDGVTFDANGYNVTTSVLGASGSGAGFSIIMGSGIWTISGNDNTILGWSGNILLTRGNPFVLDYSGGIGTRIISADGLTSDSEANSPDISISAGTDIINISTNSKLHDLDFTGFGGSLFNGVAGNMRNRTIYGNLTASTTMTFMAGNGTTTFAGTSGTQVIISNGKNFDFPLTFNGLGGTFQLADNISSGTTTNRNITLTAGTLDLNGQTFTNFGAFVAGSGSSVRVLDFNGGTYENTSTTLSAPVFSYIVGGTNFTTVGSGTIKISGATTNIKQMTISATGGLSLPDLWYANPIAGADFRILGSNTFSGIKVTNGVAQTLKFQVGTTTTISSAAGWDVSGTVGNPITIDTSAVGTHTISVASGVVSSDYLNISNSIASGTPFFYAGANSIDNGNNTGWIFTAPDATLPNLITTSITSTDANGYAQVGDTITLSFVTDEPIQIPVTTIFSGGNPVTGIINTLNPSANEWEVTYVVEATDTEGLVTFAIDYSDLIGNPGVTGTATTDATSVTIGEVPVVPVVESGNIYGSTTNPAYIKPTTTSSVTSSITPTTVSSADNLPFTHDLFRGSVETDVRELQKFLNTHGFIVSESGYGSPGHEVLTFGPKTEAAVIKFQIANNITPSVGYFGPKTRALVNSLI